MPAAVQAKMEAAFGADFSAVRIHEGRRSEVLGARAYTQGTNLQFAPGEYQPESQKGQELLGHELTHVVQQSQGRVSAMKHANGVGVNDDAGLEAEADAMGAKAARGESGSGPSGAGGLEGAGMSTGVQFSKEKGSKPLDTKITISADTDSKFLSKEYRKEGAVGHAWIKVQEPNKPEDSYGFWPANLGSGGGGFDRSKPWKSVPGEVLHPDTSHTAKQEMTVSTDAAGLSEGLKYKSQNESRNYNLLTYNCTTFARNFFKKATGQAAPSAGFLGLAENPNWLADNIEKRNKREEKKKANEAAKTAKPENEST